MKLKYFFVLKESPPPKVLSCVIYALSTLSTFQTVNKYKIGMKRVGLFRTFLKQLPIVGPEAKFMHLLFEELNVTIL